MSRSMPVRNRSIQRGWFHGFTLRMPSIMPRAQRARWRARWTSRVGAAVKATAEGS
jgi:hypothetical protein